MQESNILKPDYRKQLEDKDVAPTIPQTKPNKLQEAEEIPQELDISFERNLELHHFQYIQEHRKNIAGKLAVENTEVLAGECKHFGLEQGQASLQNYLASSNDLQPTDKHHLTIFYQTYPKLLDLIKMALETYHEDYFREYLLMVLKVCQSFNKWKQKKEVKKTSLESTSRITDFDEIDTLLSVQQCKSLYHCQHTKNDIFEQADGYSPAIAQQLNQKCSLLNYRKYLGGEKLNEDQYSAFEAYVKGTTRVLYLLFEGYYDCSDSEYSKDIGLQLAEHQYEQNGSFEDAFEGVDSENQDGIYGTKKFKTN